MKSASERLKKNADKILKTWSERASREIFAATHQESLALRNSLPEYLDHLSDALSSTVNRTESRIKADRIRGQQIGKRHGLDRSKSLNYTIDQLIYEYHILRQAICEVLEEEAPLTSTEREVIASSIEQSVNDAATQFSDSLRAIQEALSYSLAHDLRTPITVAKTSAQLILKNPNDADHCVTAATWISASMDRIDSMIRDLLDASRIRAGQRLSLQFEELDLDLIARQVAEEANFTHGRRFFVESSGQCIGYWSKSGLRRLLENLTTNAAKYGEPGTPVTIGIKRTESTVLLSVHNHGKAIPPDERAILFQQFRRARSGEAKTGWGLGLTLVKGMAEAHRGTVSVESEEGKGTIFRVELPRDWRTKGVSPGKQN